MFQKEVITDVSDLIGGVDISNSKDTIFTNGNDADWARYLVGTAFDLQVYHGLQPFEGHVVVDLGAGSKTFGAYAAHLLGAEGYVAVEPNHADKLAYRLSNDFGIQQMTSDDGIVRRMKVATVSEDMLSFLKRIEGLSIAVMSSGIDPTILGREYMEEVECQIERVLAPDAAYLAHKTYLHPKNLDCTVEILPQKKYPFHRGLSRLYVQPKA